MKVDKNTNHTLGELKLNLHPDYEVTRLTNAVHEAAASLRTETTPNIENQQSNPMISSSPSAPLSQTRRLYIFRSHHAFEAQAKTPTKGVWRYLGFGKELTFPEVVDKINQLKGRLNYSLITKKQLAEDLETLKQRFAAEEQSRIKKLNRLPSAQNWMGLVSNLFATWYHRAFHVSERENKRLEETLKKANDLIRSLKV